MRLVARLAVRTMLLALAAVAPLSACHDSPSQASGPPRRDCSLTVWYKASSAAAHVELVGSWNGYARPGIALDAANVDGWRAARVDGASGVVTYAIIDDGVWIADPNVPTSAFHDVGGTSTEVAWVEVPSCDAPAVRIDDAAGSSDGGATVHASFLASARGGDGVDPSTVTLDGEAGGWSIASVDVAKGTLAITGASLAPGKHALLVGAKDVRGRDAEPARATVWIEPRPFDVRDMVLYQVVVDRYRGKDGSPLREPDLLSGRAGGHIDGVRRAVESGELAAMGFNAVWISPLYANPSGTFPGADGRPYSSYHGYWPIAPRALEPSVADEASLDALVAAAHARGMRIIFDVVPNHVHEQHPYFAAHKGDGWFNHVDGSCVCGTATCDWATHIQDCWFAPYLPDLDWRVPAVADRGSSDVAWWLDRFGADGVRIDAVPMMPRAATRRIAYELRKRFDHPGNRTFLLGENFTGPGGYGLLRYELGPYGLDSEFHFPLLWALRGAVGSESASMKEIAASVETGQDEWRGSGAVMGLIIGNHDVPRFASVAAGDGGGDPWTPAEQPIDPLVYQKQALALGLVLTLPGVPVVYYGDEIGLAGHADPDARRVMPTEAELSLLQTNLRQTVSALAKARGCSEALRRGDYQTLYADDERVIFARRVAGGESAVVVAQRRPASPFSSALPGIPEGDYVDLLTGAKASLRPALTNLPAAPFSLSVFLPAGSPCTSP